MKLMIEGDGLNVKAIKAEYTPVEWLVVKDAMRRYAKETEANTVDKLIMREMLSIVSVEFEV